MGLWLKKNIWKPIYHQIWQDVNSYNCLYLFRRNPIFYYTLTKVVSRYWTRNIPYIPNQGYNLSDPIWVNLVSIWSIWTDRDIFAATKQLYEWLSPSVRPSVRPSVCLSVTLFTMFPSSHHHEIVRCYYQWEQWCPCKTQGQRSRLKVTMVNLPVSGP